MRALNKLKSLVGSGAAHDDTVQTGTAPELPDINALITSIETPRDPDEKAKPAAAQLRTEKSKADTSPAPISVPEDNETEEAEDLLELTVTIPAKGPVVLPPALKAAKQEKTPPRIAPAKQEETDKPMSKSNAAPKPSDQLSADLAALDNLKTSAPSPQPAKQADETARELGPRRKTAGLKHMRNDLAQLNKDMSSGEQFYAQSLRRINDLIEYAYETETTLSALEKLEPENVRLKEELMQASAKLTDQVVRAESAKSKADAYENRYLETRQALEKSQLSLTQMEALRETLSREIETKDNDLAIMINKAREIKNAHNLDIKALDDYKAKASELANELSLTLSGRHEIEQRLQDLSTRYESLKSERNSLERMVTQTRNAQKATEEHNLALKTKLETVLSDVKIFKQQFDAAAQNKEAEIGLLRSKLADMDSELAVKDGVVGRAHDEMAELRDKFETAHRGRRKLLEHIEGQKAETDHLKSELEKAQSEHSQLTSDFVQAQNDIEALRRVNDAQSDKLKRYTALNQKPVVAPASFSISANPFSADPAPKTPERPPEQTPKITQEPPVFATSDTPPPHPGSETVESVIAALDAVQPLAEITPEPSTGSVDLQTDSPTDTYVDINHDFRREDTGSSESSMGYEAPEMTDFDKEFAELSAMAPIKAETPVREDASAALKSDAEKIEEALLEFHDLDLLADSAD